MVQEALPELPVEVVRLSNLSVVEHIEIMQASSASSKCELVTDCL